MLTLRNNKGLNINRFVSAVTQKVKGEMEMLS